MENPGTGRYFAGGGGGSWAQVVPSTGGSGGNGGGGADKMITLFQEVGTTNTGGWKSEQVKLCWCRWKWYCCYKI